MNEADRLLLVYQYPILRNFINECFLAGEPEKFIDFLFSLEIEANHSGH